ncbi:MAG: CoA transferase [Thermodesulfobacteriota bacterium]|nr:CoA transferase [Thermodesulfobacteriota bacterium]
MAQQKVWLFRKMKLTGNINVLLTKTSVLDLADEKASFCSKLLADLGASVIKVERPGGDPSRRLGPFLKSSSKQKTSLSFEYNNSNKRGITLDIEQSAGREIFLRLIRKTDIIVVTSCPGYMKDMDLGFDALSEINPGLIMVSVTGFGKKGPRCRYTSCDLVACAFGGAMHVSGFPSCAPVKPFGEQSYYAASLYCAVAILLALRSRAQSGKGKEIDVSLQEAVTSTIDHVMVRYFFDRIIPKRQGGLHWDNSFCIFACKDGYILLTLFQQWETLIGLLDNEGMADDLTELSWKDEHYRREHIDHVIEVLQRWAMTHTKSELFELGQLMHFPWAPIQSPSEVLKSPQLEARGFFTQMDHHESDMTVKYPGVPYRFSNTLFHQRRRAPLIGEDNLSVYQKELGLSGDQILELSSSGVI